MRTSDFDPVSFEVFTKQIRRATLFVLVVFSVLILRLWFLQIMNGHVYRSKSEHNRIRLQDVSPSRGIIFDRNGKVLVDNRPSYDLCVIPEEVQDKGQLLQSLTQLIGLDPGPAGKLLNVGARGLPFKPVCVKSDISRNELAIIETNRFNLPGVLIKVKQRRRYISGNLASHVLGYLGEITEEELKTRECPNNKSGDLIGKSGAEWKWQTVLNGKRGGEQIEVDAAGRTIKVISRQPPLSGTDIYLTIDKNLQGLAEKALSGKRGAIVAMDPMDGEILALASSPPYDPNLFVGGIDKESWERIVSSEDFALQNRALTGQYPPGSVFKIVVALAGLEEGVIDPAEELFCNGVYQLGLGKYHCWKKHGHGKVALHRALVESCDVYFYRIGKRLGVDKIASYARRLGLGEKTGVDVGREKSGLIPTKEWKLRKWGSPWQAGETVSLAIGQSFILVTPIQMARLISAIFDGEVLPKPRVTKHIGKTQTERPYEPSQKETGRLGIKQEHLELVRKALAGVVNEPHGTGSKARLKGVTVAGKTGTAQVVALEIEKRKGQNHKNEVPFEFRDHAWFVAVAPVKKPKIAIAILVEHGGHGGSAAAPIAKEIIGAYLGKSG
ncbi:MAG: penicillin-binding protein 2 [Pseudomonadota bacterium]